MRRVVSLGALVGLVLIAPFAAVPAYDFPAPRPFTGPQWANPYAGWSGAPLKVNLHTHSLAWGGLTAGADEPLTLAQAYADRGYDALAISNYLSVERLEGAPLPMVRAYEHGLNASKSHRLVFGSSSPVRFDFPLSTRSMRQFILEALAEPGSLVALAHPALQHGHGCDETASLTGFQLLEVHNPYATSHLEWDCALTAGRLAWVLGDDDAHVARDESIGVAWNRIEASPDEAAILQALRQGRSYVVRGERGAEDVTLRSLEVDAEGALTIELTGPAMIEWVGDPGAVRQVDRDVPSSTYRPDGADHYLRVVVRTPRTEMLFNPIVRSGAWSAPRASIDWPTTLGGWLGWLVAAAAVARLNRPRQHLRLVVAPRRAA